MPDLEREACETASITASFFASEVWETFCQTVLQIWRERDHVIVRGLPALAEGASLLLAALCLAGRFKTYASGYNSGVFENGKLAVSGFVPGNHEST